MMSRRGVWRSAFRIASGLLALRSTVLGAEEGWVAYVLDD